MTDQDPEGHPCHRCGHYEFSEPDTLCLACRMERGASEEEEAGDPETAEARTA